MSVWNIENLPGLRRAALPGGKSGYARAALASIRATQCTAAMPKRGGGKVTGLTHDWRGFVLRFSLLS